MGTWHLYRKERPGSNIELSVNDIVVGHLEEFKISLTVGLPKMST